MFTKFITVLFTIAVFVCSSNVFAAGGGGGGGGSTGSGVPFLHPILHVVLFLIIVAFFKKKNK